MTDNIKDTKFNWRFWLNYRWIVKNIPFFLYCALLCVIYIANGHYGDKMVKRINVLGRQSRELGFENKNLSGKMLLKSKLSQIETVAKELGLSQGGEQPVVVNDSLKIKIN